MLVPPLLLPRRATAQGRPRTSLWSVRAWRSSSATRQSQSDPGVHAAGPGGDWTDRTRASAVLGEWLVVRQATSVGGRLRLVAPGLLRACDDALAWHEQLVWGVSGYVTAGKVRGAAKIPNLSADLVRVPAAEAGQGSRVRFTAPRSRHLCCAVLQSRAVGPPSPGKTCCLATRMHGPLHTAERS